MKLGVFTPVFGRLSCGEMLEAVRALRHVQAVELGTGCWPGAAHVDVERLQSAEGAREFRGRIADAGLVISALSCHGNPLHPNAAIAGRDDDVFRRTVLLAERLDVPVVVTFSGCPGDSEQARHPNWVTSPWPPEMSEMLEWQWEQRAIPYWRETTRYAAEHGVKVAIEPHPNFLVYNTETALRLREGGGPNLGVNFDPSHFFWQGIDIPVAIRALGDAIFHVHAKDVALDAERVAMNGVIDAKSYRRMRDRSWIFRTVGSGHSEFEWKRIVAALRLAGYDGVISIEHEDALASVDEGVHGAVDVLSRIIFKEPPAEAWWT